MFLPLFCLSFQRVPPLRVDDLINDLRDGTKLIALLEVLSGEKLPVEKGRVLRRPHFLSNANTALQFLASKRIKLVNINPADLVDGRPPVVLGLIWTIILYFQVSVLHSIHMLGTLYCLKMDQLYAHCRFTKKKTTKNSKRTK